MDFPIDNQQLATILSDRFAIVINFGVDKLEAQVNIRSSVMSKFRYHKKMKMKMKTLNTTLTGVAAIMLASCASIVSKSEYPVSLMSSPAGAKVQVKKNGMVVHEGTTPSTVTLSASSGFFTAAKYEVIFSKKGHPQQTIPLTADIDGWYFGNILFGGLIGLLIVDPATGAMFKLPESLNASFASVASIEGNNGKVIHIVDRSTLPAEIEAQLVAVR